ncbi:MAG: PAS domain S-box protein [Chloroflexi bacterium]|nr:PAS domain S-box protein [Chloroflexota bacterium]
MLTSILELLSPPAFEHEEQMRVARLLRVISYAILVMFILAGAAVPFVTDTPVPPLASAGIGAALQLSVIYLLRRHQIRLASILLCAALWTIITVITPIFGGIGGPVAAAYGVVVLIAGVLLGGRIGILVAGLSVAALAGALYVDTNPVLAWKGYPVTPASAWVTQTSILVGVALLIYLTMDNLHSALERARSGERAQIEANRELVRLRASLETRIADQERAESSLRESQALYQSLVENLPQSVFLKDRLGRFVFANRRMCAEFGRPLEEMLGKTDLDLFPETLALAYRADDQKITSEGCILEKEEEHELLTGPRSYVQVVKMPTRDSAGRVTGVQGIYWDITERKLAEGALRQSHDELEKVTQSQSAELARERTLLRTLIDALPDYIYVKDTECRFILTNLAQARHLGVPSSEDLVGKSDRDYFPRRLAEKFYTDDRNVILSGNPLIGETEPTVDSKGTYKWTLTTKVPFRDADGKIVGLVGLGRDITQQKQIEEELERERNLLRTVIENSPDAIFVRDMQGRFVVANPATLDFYGVRAPDEIVGKRLADILPPGIAPLYGENDARILTHGESFIGYEKQKPFSRPGHPEWALTTKIPLRDRAGTIIGLVGILHDITERKQMEQTLTRERNLLRTLIDTIPDNIVFKDLAGRFVLGNRASLKFLEAENQDAIVGKTVFDFFPLPVAEKSTADDRTVLQGGKPVVNVEEQIIAKATGRQIWAQTTKVPLQDDDGNVVGLLSITHDISERRRMEEALRESEERFRELFEVSPDAVVLLDTSDERRVILDCNQAACVTNGYTRQELIGQPIHMLIADRPEPHEPAKHLARLRAGETRQYEDRLRRKDGSEFPVETSTKLITLPGRELILRIDRDITERKETEEALRLQAQRLYTAARVARVVTSILDIDLVLPEVVALIRERFGYSYARSKRSWKGNAICCER